MLTYVLFNVRVVVMTLLAPVAAPGLVAEPVTGPAPGAVIMGLTLMMMLGNDGIVVVVPLLTVVGVAVVGVAVGLPANGLTVVAGAEDEVAANDDMGGDAEMTFPRAGTGNKAAPTESAGGTAGDGVNVDAGVAPGPRTEAAPGPGTEAAATGPGPEAGTEGTTEAAAGEGMEGTTEGIEEAAGEGTEGTTEADPEGAVTAVSPTIPSYRPIHRRKYLNAYHNTIKNTMSNAKYIHEFMTISIIYRNLFVSATTRASAIGNMSTFKHISLHAIDCRSRRNGGTNNRRFRFYDSTIRRHRTHGP